MSANYVRIYGASDDLLEFEGAIHDEMPVYGRTTVKLTISNEVKGSYRPAVMTTLYITAEFSGPLGEWELGIATATDSCELDVEIELTQRASCHGDPSIIIHLADDDIITIDKVD